MKIFGRNDDEVDDSESQFDLDPSSESAPSGPFGGVAPVDPIVYKEADDSPELRPAAYYVQAAPRLSVRDQAPRLPEPKNFPEWTPGPRTVTDSSKPVPDPEKRSVLRTLFFLAVVLVPVALIGWALSFAVQLYQAP